MFSRRPSRTLIPSCLMNRASVTEVRPSCQSSELRSHAELYHQQPSTQYSAGNAWNLNNNGNINNNNKYNKLNAVPLSESNDKGNDIGGYIVPVGEIYDAYCECLRNKARTFSAMKFTLDLEKNIRQLWKSLNDRTYTIGRSIAFIVEHPVKREVFAADFRDRVVHVWMCKKLVPLFEEYLPDCMSSNRVGKGTSYAINYAYRLIEEVSQGYTTDAWIWKFDLQGFFMSIDKRILNGKLQQFIDERYFAPDKSVLKWIVEKVIMRCPQQNCIRKSKLCAWDGLRADKSLFTQDEFHGMPIGNLPSQLFANFLLSDMVRYLHAYGFRCVQYVDDVVVVHRSKAEILSFIPQFRLWLKDSLGITLHPRKCYIQHFSKGVAFVGGIIRPHRIYLSHRSYRKALGKTHWIAQGGGTLSEALATVNSYLGLARHYYAYKLRKRLAEMLFSRFRDAICFNENYKQMIISHGSFSR